MFMLFQKIKTWYLKKRFRDLYGDIKFTLYREINYRNSPSYNEYIRQCFDPVSKVVKEEEND